MSTQPEHVDETDAEAFVNSPADAGAPFAQLVGLVKDHGMFLLDPEGVILSWNPGAERLYGYPEEEILGRHFSRFFPTDSVAKGFPQHQLDQAAALNQFEDEGWRIRKNGTRFWANVLVAALRDHHGRLQGFAKIAKDLSRHHDHVASQFLNTVIETTFDAIITIDDQGNIQTFNRMAEKLFGYTATEAIGQNVKFLMPEPYQREHDHYINKYLRTGVRKIIGTGRKVSAQRKDGSVFPIELAVSEFSFQGVRRFLGSIRDITDQQRIKDALKTSERRFQLALDAAHLGVWEVSLPDRTLTWDAAYGALYGRGPELHPKNEAEFMLCVLPEERSSIQTAFRNAVVDGTDYACEFRILWPNGEIRWHAALGRRVLDDQGQPYKVIGVGMDITERKLSEQRLRESEERFRQMANNVPVMIWIADVQGNCTFLNERWSQFTGQSEGQGLGAIWFQSVHPEDQTDLKNLVNKAKAELRPFQMEYRLRRHDGEYRWVIDHAHPRYDSQGAFHGYIGCVLDLTERKQLEEQLHRSQKMEAFGQLAGGVAHDFNNLLTIIIGYGDLLLRQLPTDHPALAAIREIGEAGERAAGLTRQMLAFSRQTMLAPKVFNVNTIVSETEKMLRRLIGEDILFTTKLADNLGLVKLDPGQLGQILINLALNARDSMPKGGALTVETGMVRLDAAYAAAHPETQPGAYVVLSVSDNGCGMTPVIRERIFEPFFTTKGPGHGTGLGLAVVHGIVKQSGGSIEVYSEPNFGSVFKLYFPIVENETPAPDNASGNAELSGIETILLVEDESAVRNLAFEILRQRGYAIVTAENGNEALTVAQSMQSPVDLLITDVVMPGMDGRDLALRLQNLNPRMSVLFVSGYTDDAVVRHGILHEQVAFLQKPFSPTALAQKVRELLDQKTVT